MPAFTATAPAKIILFGEHAVVYGRPAIAVPVPALQARAIVRADVHAETHSVRLIAPAIGLNATMSELPPTNPLRRAVELTAETLQAAFIPSCQITIQSTIPVAAGMGSGAAVSVALMRALAAYLGHPLPAETISALAFEVEKIHHGNPSGVDNTVIALERAVYFVRGKAPQLLSIQIPFQLVIADSGIASPTAQVVSDVRTAWQKNQAEYEGLFDQIATIVNNAFILFEKTSPTKTPEDYLIKLGGWMNENQAILKQLGTSCPELDQLVEIARQAGAYGAKLSGYPVNVLLHVAV
ncbi:MAG: mevalonate kinase, partial [Anaerolineales bacterium]